VLAEIVSIGIFIPLFELINQHEISGGLSQSNSDLIIFMQNFMDFFGQELNIESLLILSFSLFVFSKILLYLTAYIQAYYTGLITKNMKDNLLSKYLQAGPSYYDSISIGDFTNSSSVELPAAVNGVMLPIKLMITALSGIGSIVLLLAMSPQLTFLSIFVIGIGVLLPLRWVKATTKAGKKNSYYRSVVTSFLLNRLRSPKLIRLSNTADIEKKHYSRLTEKQRHLTLAIHLLKARITLVLEPIIIGISLLMFYIAFVFMEMPVSSILLYMAVMVRVVPIATNLLTQKQSINRSMGPIQAVERLLVEINQSIATYKKNIPNNILTNIIHKVDTLKFQGVYYNYTDCENDVLSNINYTFNKSTLTAIVGPSGSGKTTFIDIISGYRRPTSGIFLINKVDTAKYNQKMLMSLISYVSQTSKIFDGISIYDYITYGQLNSTKEGVINASKLSGAYDFIKDLPKGFDTVLVGDSSSLSGGQKQRLNLTRALLGGRPILIMDEPTGSLDSISERRFMLNIENIRKETGKIIIVIAHRISTIVGADQIIVLENGSISGVGTHLELIKNNTWYKKAVHGL